MSNPKNKLITIAVDAMGGDYGPESSIPGLGLVHREFPHVRFTVFGDENRIYPLLNKHKSLIPFVEVVHTDKFIAGDEKPSIALRASKGTSMRLAVEAVKDGVADAAVSSGNTGALMALAKVVLRPLDGIRRPAIASVFPSLRGGSTVMLDLGANVLVDGETLVQFAVLGAVFARMHKDLEMPRVGLLNVGSEEMKGPDHVRMAAEALSKIDFPGKYIGFVEGDDITTGDVDVVVSDGYAGNIALKAVEGVGEMTGKLFRKSFKSGPFAMLGGLLAYAAIKRLEKKVDPRLYNGGVFLGLNGLCVKSHGCSDPKGFASAVRLSVQLAQHDYINRVADEINHLMKQETLLS